LATECLVDFNQHFLLLTFYFATAKEQTMLELVKYIVTSLVDEKDKVEVTIDDNKRITIAVAQSDMGKVIGKSGKVAKAIRTVCRALAQKEGERYTIDILEPGEDGGARVLREESEAAE